MTRLNFKIMLKTLQNKLTIPLNITAVDQFNVPFIQFFICKVDDLNIFLQFTITIWRIVAFFSQRWKMIQNIIILSILLQKVVCTTRNTNYYCSGSFSSMRIWLPLIGSNAFSAQFLFVKLDKYFCSWNKLNKM